MDAKRPYQMKGTAAADTPNIVAVIVLKIRTFPVASLSVNGSLGATHARASVPLVCPNTTTMEI